MLPAVLRAHEPGTFHSGFIEFSLPSPITPWSRSDKSIV
jgi:hypothetical protein